MHDSWKIGPAVLGLSFALLLSGAAPPVKPEKKQTTTPAAQKPQRPSPIVYKPPKRGAPRGRVGGGSRGPRDERPVLWLLVPDHTGLTVQEAPDLFWYISRLPDHPIELTINDENEIKPLLETRLERPAQPGIQRVQLEEYAIHLKPGITYQWFVALVVDADSRSKDILAGGWVQRVGETDELKQKLTGAERTEAPLIYAEAGLWYDAVQAVSDLVDAYPHDPIPRQQRAALLGQVGLSEVAATDPHGAALPAEKVPR